MEKNIFHSIFTIPIDGEQNSDLSFLHSTKKDNQEDSQVFIENKIIQNYFNLPSNYIYPSNEISIYPKKEEDLSECRKSLESTELIIFSDCKKNSEIKSKANSSKIFISEILKHNWKLRCKRFIRKMKTKYVKTFSKLVYKFDKY